MNGAAPCSRASLVVYLPDLLDCTFDPYRTFDPYLRFGIDFCSTITCGCKHVSP